MNWILTTPKSLIIHPTMESAKRDQKKCLFGAMSNLVSIISVERNVCIWFLV